METLWYIYSTTKETHHLYFGKYFYNLFNNNIINYFPTTDVHTRIYYHPSDRIDG